MFDKFCCPPKVWSSHSAASREINIQHIKQRNALFTVWGQNPGWGWGAEVGRSQPTSALSTAVLREGITGSQDICDSRASCGSQGPELGNESLLWSFRGRGGGRRGLLHLLGSRNWGLGKGQDLVSTPSVLFAFGGRTEKDSF